MSQYPPDAMISAGSAPRAVASAAWHSLVLACLRQCHRRADRDSLLFPALNRLLGEWTYGRWIMVHMNLELYGWTSLPMAGFLFKVYGADRGPLAQWCRPVLWVWSAALAVGAYSWLSGHSSGKLFLDWSGYARIFFPLAMIALWLLLAVSFVREWKTAAKHDAAMPHGAQSCLASCFCWLFPCVMYIASSPGFYPAINPDTGGPTGASQLESSLIIVAILLMLPFGLTRRKADIPG
jgi:cytochrome c oxidase cbb3-type subunit 1